MRVLLEMRPALDGHAGIPQETRLLFRTLQQLDGVHVDGLLQSSNRVLAGGLPADGRGLPEHRRIHRLSRVVVSLQGGGKRSRLERIAEQARLVWRPGLQLAATMLGRRVRLGRFEAEHFKDFVWRSLFARTLPHEDFDAVTSAGFRVARVPWSAAHAAALITRRAGLPVYPTLDTGGYDLMVAETPYPGRVSRPTRLVVRYHDAIPLLMPHTISDRSYHQASHYHALRRNIRDGAWFACVSEATRKDLLSVFPEAADRAVTIHNTVSHHYFVEDSARERVADILQTRLNQRVKDNRPNMAALRDGRPVEYLLMVSTIEPRKNHLAMLAAWEQLQAQRHPDLKLVLVGSLGWDHKAILRKFRPWLDRGGLYMLEDVPAAELRLLYRHAAVTVCPSFGEGFDFSGVEAMRCGGVVAASDIPVHREVFANAAEYFSPYSVSGLAAALERLIGPEGSTRRHRLIATGTEVSARYTVQAVLPRWRALLDAVGAAGAQA